MKTNNLNAFLLTVITEGKEIQLKTIKCIYALGRTMYKVALPSSLSDTTICWIAGRENKWEITLGDLKPALANALILAINKLEEVHYLDMANESFNLKSA